MSNTEEEMRTDSGAADSLEKGIGEGKDGTAGDGKTGRGKASDSRSKLETAILMSTLCTAVFLAALDITIVSTALPTMAAHFKSTAGYTWIGSAFLLAAAVVAPSWGKFSDIWGRKPVLMLAIATFFLGSTLCGASVNLGMIITGRAIQGAAAGGLLSLVSIVVGDTFSQRDRGKYYGVVGFVWAVAFVLGPLVGGAFTERVSWRWCFYINLPISGLSFVIIALMLKLETPKTPLLEGIKVIDWPGTFALISGLLMLLLGLQLGGTVYPWDSATVLCLIVIGVATLLAFVAVEQYWAKNPLIPIHLYTNVSNGAIIVANLFHGIVLTANTYFLPLYCQSVLGSTPLLSGVLLLPFAFSMSIALLASGNYLKRTGQYRGCIRVGFAVLTLGVGLYYDLPDGKMWAKIIIYQIIAGVGIGLDFQPPMIALQSNVPAQDNGAATASFGLVRNVASAIGVVIGSVVFGNGMDSQQPMLVKELNNSTAALFTGSNAQASVLLIKLLSTQQQAIVRRAYWMSIRTIWIVAVSFAGAALLISLLIEKKELSQAHVVVKTGLAGEEERRKIVMEQKAARRQPASAR